jgi:fructose-bisphosphate aldolase class I
MKPIPELELKQLLRHARSEGVYGTKARSLILSAASAANANNIDSDDNSSNDGVDQIQNHQNIIQLVKQQFDLARLVLKEGLIPIIEPEIDINCPNKQLCEEILVKALLNELNLLMLEDDESQLSLDNNNKKKKKQVIIKITIPEKSNQYLQVINHPCCLRVIALSGGYTQQKACRKLYQNKNLIASFSRAFTIDLKHTMTNTEFDESLANNINIIYNASCNDKSIESY